MVKVDPLLILSRSTCNVNRENLHIKSSMSMDLTNKDQNILYEQVKTRQNGERARGDLNLGFFFFFPQKPPLKAEVEDAFGFALH